ncbi:MAG: hypothetical protein ACI9SC_002920 [Gammaproteobacteria bacterium]|jgi:hypothetical protein
MKAIKYVLLFCILVANVMADELVPDDFARALILETDGSTAIYEIKLPASVYETVVRHDLGDMRVFNANEERVPHTLRRPEQIEDTETRVSLPIFPLYGINTNNLDNKLNFTTANDGAILTLREHDNALVTENAKIQKYVIDASRIGKKIAALEVELVGAGDNYVKKLTIETSKDLSRWRRLVNNVTLTRLQYGEHLLQEKKIELHQAHERYLRLSWQDASDGIQLSAVKAVLKNKENKDKPNWLMREAELIDAQQQIYQFDTKGAFPVEQFNIVLPEGNTLIEADLGSRSETRGDWHPRYQGLFYNLHVEGNQIQNDAVAIRTVEDRYWQLKVKTDDGMGKIAPRFRFAWSGHSLLFLARGPAPFTLAYGSGKAGPTEPPVAALLDVLNNKRQAGFTAAAHISGTQELSGDAARDKLFDISWQRSVLWLVLALGVLILGAMAFRLLREMNQ